MKVVGQLLRGVEVHDVDIGVRWSHPGHVGAVQHHGDHVVGQNFEELLRDVVLALDYNIINEVTPGTGQFFIDI